MAHEREIPERDKPFPPASHLSGEPANWVIGVIDDPIEATQAVQAAREAGFPEEELLMFHGEQAIRQAEIRDGARNPLTKIGAAVSRVLTDPGNAEAEYIEEARQGHALVNIRAKTPERMEQARRILEAHSAHRIKHFSTWSVTDLSR